MAGITLKEADGVVRVVLDRPERRNALGLALMGELLDAFRDLARRAADGGERGSAVVVLEANGPAFSAGHDLSEMVGRDAAYYDELFALCTDLMLAVRALPQPVVAKVQGPATAAGCQLVASCDLAVASEDAWFATPGVKIGLFCSTPMVPVTRVVGTRRAMLMLLTGRQIDAHTARDWGLVNDVVAPWALDDAVDRLVDEIRCFSPRVIGLGKRAFYAQIDVDEREAYRRMQAVMAANAADPDAQEGIAAFLDKRPPRWDATT